MQLRTRTRTALTAVLLTALALSGCSVLDDSNNGSPAGQAEGVAIRRRPRSRTFPTTSYR